MSVQSDLYRMDREFRRRRKAAIRFYRREAATTSMNRILAVGFIAYAISRGMPLHLAVSAGYRAFYNETATLPEIIAEIDREAGPWRY